MSSDRQVWPRRDDLTPHPLVQAVAAALHADHVDCDPESCCQRNSGPDWVEAHKALAAINDAGYAVTLPDLCARAGGCCETASRLSLPVGDDQAVGQ